MKIALVSLLLLSSVCAAEVTSEFSFKDCVEIERAPFFRKHCGKTGTFRIDDIKSAPDSYSYYTGAFINSKNADCDYAGTVFVKDQGKAKLVSCDNKKNSNINMPYGVIPDIRKKRLGLPYEM